MPLLALFDVDGTLFLTSDRVAGQALRETLVERFGVELPEDPVPRIDHPGQTCLRIARLVLREAGLGHAEIDAGLPDWCPRFGERYLELLGQADTSAWQAAPEAADALARLTQAGVLLALLTGNPERMARARMERLGLASHFPPGQGGFGCDGETRRELIERARERAGNPPLAATVAIGDTRRDVEGARESGIRSIVLRSPNHPDAHLHADAVAEDLEGVAAQLLAWNG